MRQNGHALHDAAAGLTADRKLVLKAVRKVGCALQHALQEVGAERKADHELVLTAVRQAAAELTEDTGRPLNTTDAVDE